MYRGNRWAGRVLEVRLPQWWRTETSNEDNSFSLSAIVHSAACETSVILLLTCVTCVMSFNGGASSPSTRWHSVRSAHRSVLRTIEANCVNCVSCVCDFGIGLLFCSCFFFNFVGVWLGEVGPGLEKNSLTEMIKPLAVDMTCDCLCRPSVCPKNHLKMFSLFYSWL